MIRKMMVFIAVIALAGICQAVTVDGYCYLENQTNHAGTKVLFEADSPSAVTDSTYTNTDGHFQIDLQIGIYNISYNQDGYYIEELENQEIFSSITLSSITLIEIPIGTPISGSISGSLDDPTYLVMDDIWIDEGESLVIAPGTILFFMGDTTPCGFDVYGYLSAVGNENDSIKFKPGTIIHNWDGITFHENSSNLCTLSYCLIYKSDSHGISCDSASIFISNSVITNCNTTTQYGGGIHLAYSNTNIAYCTVFENSAYRGGGIYIHQSSPDISYCLIYNNHAGQLGGGINSHYSDPTISNCTITGNSSISQGGGIYFIASNVDVNNTVIDSNTGGGGVHMANSDTTCLVFNNLYNNLPANFTGEVPSYLGQLLTVNANGDSSDIFFNIFEDPLFVDPAGGDYHLQENSPCIDAGDPTSPLDPDLTIADIGAFYFDQGGPQPEPEISVSSDLLYFGHVLIGEQGDMPLTVYNIGDTTLVLYDVICNPPEIFAVNYDPADSLIEAGDSLELAVYFYPLVNIAYDGILTIDNSDELTDVTLRGFGDSRIEVALTPYNPPIIIPETGGSFDFNIEVENNTSDPQTFDLWTQIELPGVGMLEIMNVPDLTLSGNVSVDRDRAQTVPEFAPAGTYTYYAYVGEYPWVIESFDSFTFEKEGTDQGGSLGAASDWLCDGEGFGELILQGDARVAPTEFALLGAYPNPFNPTTTISFSLPEAARVRLEVFDINGRNVGVGLAPTRYYTPGAHEITFDASHLSSGIYIYRLQAGEFTASHKMILLK